MTRRTSLQVRPAGRREVAAASSPCGWPTSKSTTSWCTTCSSPPCAPSPRNGRRSGCATTAPATPTSKVGSREREGRGEGGGGAVQVKTAWPCASRSQVGQRPESGRGLPAPAAREQEPERRRHQDEPVLQQEANILRLDLGLTLRRSFARNSRRLLLQPQHLHHETAEGRRRRGSVDLGVSSWRFWKFKGLLLFFLLHC